MTRTIVVANQKGGVGKTTTAVSLAHGLALEGHNVLLVDLDPQGNCSPCLGVIPEAGLRRLLFYHLGDEAKAPPWDELLREVRPRLWLLPSNTETAQLKVALCLFEDGKRETFLADALASLAMDYIILDTAPSRDVLHTAAHYAADQVLIPCQLDHLSLAGVAQEIETVNALRRRGHRIQILGILPTFWERSTRESQINLEELGRVYGKLLLFAVARSTQVREASAVGQTVWEYLAPGRQPREAYSRLVRLVQHGD